MNPILTAAVLAAAGAALITTSVTGLLARRDRGGTGLYGRAYSEVSDTGLIPCAAPSPDDSLSCNLNIGHGGWHARGATSWFGDTWNCDHWADTQAGPTVAAPAPPAPAATVKTHVAWAIADDAVCAPGAPMRLTGEMMLVQMQVGKPEQPPVRPASRSSKAA